MTARLLSIDEAARRLSVGRTKVYELIAQGQLKSKRIGRRRFIAEDDLASFIEGLPA